MTRAHPGSVADLGSWPKGLLLPKGAIRDYGTKMAPREHAGDAGRPDIGRSM